MYHRLATASMSDLVDGNNTVAVLTNVYDSLSGVYPAAGQAAGRRLLATPSASLTSLLSSVATTLSQTNTVVNTALSAVRHTYSVYDAVLSQYWSPVRMACVQWL